MFVPCLGQAVVTTRLMPTHRRRDRCDRRIAFATTGKKLSTGPNGQNWNEDAASGSGCLGNFTNSLSHSPCPLGRSRGHQYNQLSRGIKNKLFKLQSSNFIVAIGAIRGHHSGASPQRIRSPILTFATKKLSNGANGRCSFLLLFAQIQNQEALDWRKWDAAARFQLEVSRPVMRRGAMLELLRSLSSQ